MDKAFADNTDALFGNYNIDNIMNGGSDEEINTVPELSCDSLTTGEQLLLGEGESLREADASPNTTKSNLFARICSALLCFSFCITSIGYYSSEAFKCFKKIMPINVLALADREVFDGGLEISDENKKDSLPDQSDNKAVSNDKDSNGKAEKSEEIKEDTESKTDSGEHDVVITDLSADSPYLLRNETKYTPDVSSLAAKNIPCKSVAEIREEYGDDSPCVLLVHTHGTESYSDGDDTYSEDESFRTQDLTKNVVAVGDIMEAVFRAGGVGVIHDRNMYDKESYLDSYSRSFSSVSSTLEKYPSVAYVFDIHRDSIIDDDKIKYRPCFSFAEMSCAQMMTVVGTDEGGADHPDWENNLSFALALQKKMSSDYSDSLARNINLRSAAFNQGLSSGYLLLEIGSCGNTLGEAKRCAVLTALAICDTIGAPIQNDAEDMMKLLVADD